MTDLRCAPMLDDLPGLFEHAIGVSEVRWQEGLWLEPHLLPRLGPPYVANRIYMCAGIYTVAEEHWNSAFVRMLFLLLISSQRCTPPSCL